MVKFSCGHGPCKLHLWHVTVPQRFLILVGSVPASGMELNSRFFPVNQPFCRQPFIISPHLLHTTVTGCWFVTSLTWKSARPTHGTTSLSSRFEPPRNRCSIGHRCLQSPLPSHRTIEKLLVSDMLELRDGDDCRPCAASTCAQRELSCCQLCIVTQSLVSGHVPSLSFHRRVTKNHEHDCVRQTDNFRGVLSVHLSSLQNSHPRRHSFKTSVDITCLRDCQETSPVSASQGRHCKCPLSDSDSRSLPCGNVVSSSQSVH